MGPELEVKSLPPLSAAERSLLEMHSILVILNVLHGKLELLGDELAEDPSLFQAALDHCARIRSTLKDPALCLDELRRAPACIEQIRAALYAACDAHPEASQPEKHGAAVESVHRSLDVFAVRAAELVSRRDHPAAWLPCSIAELRADMREVFGAIEKNSGGRYHVTHNFALKEDLDYYLDFQIDSPSGVTVLIPVAFRDVIRDLLANARKYSAPGGTISAGLVETADHLVFSVQDGGIGIPPDQLEEVCQFGRRGRNVSNIRTMGGGFGLTKAVLVTLEFGGRFRISSSLGVGTRIRIDIPLPSERPSAYAA